MNYFIAFIIMAILWIIWFATALVDPLGSYRYYLALLIIIYMIFVTAHLFTNKKKRVKNQDFFNYKTPEQLQKDEKLLRDSLTRIFGRAPKLAVRITKDKHIVCYYFSKNWYDLNTFGMVVDRNKLTIMTEYSEEIDPDVKRTVHEVENDLESNPVKRRPKKRNK